MSITRKLNCNTEIVTPNWTSNNHLKIELQYRNSYPQLDVKQPPENWTAVQLPFDGFFSFLFSSSVYFSKRVYSPSSTHTTDFCNQNYVTAVMNEDRATQYGPTRCNQNCVTAVIKKKKIKDRASQRGPSRCSENYVTAVLKKDRSSHCSCGWGLLWSESAFLAWLQRGGYHFLKELAFAKLTCFVQTGKRDQNKNSKLRVLR